MISQVGPARFKFLLLAAIAIPSAAQSGNAEYVDSRLCARCHRQIAEDYARTGMGRSFFRPSATEPEARDIYHERSDTHYAMLRHGDQYFQRRWQIGLGGKEINTEELAI